jgi:hypothetical protein
MIETWLNLFGLLLTGLGAFVAARSVIILKEQAKSLSEAPTGTATKHYTTRSLPKAVVP